MTVTLIVIATLFLIFIIANIWARFKIQQTPLPPDHEKILLLNEQNFNTQLKNRLVLVDFWAEWCAPCRLMAPVLNELAAELTSNEYVGKVNIEKYPLLAQKFRIRSIPTLIIFKNGKEVQRIVGVKGKEFLIKQIQQQK